LEFIKTNRARVSTDRAIPNVVLGGNELKP